MFQLYSNHNEKAIDAKQKLSIYLRILKNSNPDFRGTDFNFTKLIGNRTDFSQRLTQQFFSNHLKFMNMKVNLLGSRTVASFTTHYFRRSGAQYRFIYASPRWSLEAIKWWGAWAKGESVGQVYNIYRRNTPKSSTITQICLVCLEMTETSLQSTNQLGIRH